MNRVYNYNLFTEGVRDKMTPKSNEEIKQNKQNIIDYITHIVELNSGHITMNKIGVSTADSTVIDVVKSENKSTIYHIITTLYKDRVKVKEYDNWTEKVLSRYFVDYADLSPDILLDIKELLKSGIVWKDIHESVRDKMTPKSEEEIRKSLSLTDTSINNKLIFGIRENLLWLCKEAIDEGADVNLKIREFRTNKSDNIVFHNHLEYITFEGRTAMVKLFLKAGAIVTEHAINIANDCDCIEIIELLREYRYKQKHNKTNESVRDKMTPKSAEEIDLIINSWTPREKFLKGYTMGFKYLTDDARKYMKEFEDVQIGDLLTTAVHKDATQQPLCIIKEKYTFNNKEEFKDYLREHPSIIIDSNALKILFKTFPKIKRDAVIVNQTFDMMFEYGRVTGVFPYTEKEIKENISKIKDKSTEINSRFHDEYLAEGVRDQMTPKSKEDIRNVLNKTNTNYEKINRIFNDFKGLYTDEELKSMIMELPWTYHTLELACKMGYLDIVKYLIENDMIHPPWKNEALWKASEYGQTDIVEYLLDKGTNIHYLDDISLIVAIRNNHQDTIKLLKDRGATLTNESVRSQMTPKSKEEVDNSFEPLLVEIAKKLQLRSRFGSAEIDKYEDAYNFVLSHRDHIRKIVDRGVVNPYTIAMSLTKFTNEYESVRSQMTPKSKKQIEDAFEDIACEIADILTEEEEFDDYFNAYEWAYDHKNIIMNEIGDEGDYNLKKIIQNILYGSNADDMHNTLWHDDIDESVRDQMTPKSEKEIDEGLEKLLDEIANRLVIEGGYKSYIRALADLKNSMEYIIDKREDGWSVDELVNKFSKNYLQESVRDKMTPKLPDDVRKQYYNLIFWKNLVDGKMSKDLEKYLTHHNFAIEKAKEVDIMNVPKTSWQKELVLYLNMIHLMRNSNDEIIKELLNLVYTLDRNKEQAALYIAIKNCVTRKYNEVNMNFRKNMGTDIMNESIRDKMTPKSEEDILKSIEGMCPNTKLFKGAREGIFWLIKQSIEEGADVNSGNHVALQLTIDEAGTNMEQLEYLLKHGADVHAHDDYALRLACEYGQLDVIEMLLQYEADPHANDDYALRYACEYGQLDTIELLLQHGANPFADGGYAIQVAEKDDRDDILELFKKYGHINEGVRSLMTPKSEEEIKKSLEKLSPNEKLTKGVINNMIWLVKQGLEEGANSYLTDRTEFSFVLQDIGNLEIAQLLVDYGADIHDLNETSLRYAARKGNYKVVKFLLDNGADLHIFTDAPLINAAHNGHVKIVKLLLDRGADVHADDDKALEMAVAGEHVDMVKVLLEAGANIHGQKGGIIGRAVDFGLSEIIKLFNQQDKANESVRDMMTPKSENDIKSLFPPIVDEIKILLDDNNIKYEVGLDQIYSDASVEIYFEIGKISYDLEIFKENERWNNNYRLRKGIGSNWKRLHITNDKDDMVNFIRGIISVKESVRDTNEVGLPDRVSEGLLRSKMIPKSEEEILKALEKLSPYKKFIYCAESGLLNVVKNMIEEEDIPLKWRSDALFNAAYDGNIDVVEYLLNIGVNIHSGDDLAFKFAVRRNHPDIIKLLIDRGADVNAAGVESYEVLMKTITKRLT